MFAHLVSVVQSDGSNSSVGGKSMESSSVITLEDSPSPPASPVGLSGPALNPHAASYPLPAGASVLSQSIPVSNHRSSSSSPRNNHMYPQVSRSVFFISYRATVSESFSNMEIPREKQFLWFTFSYFIFIFKCIRLEYELCESCCSPRIWPH